MFSKTVFFNTRHATNTFQLATQPFTPFSPQIITSTQPTDRTTDHLSLEQDTSFP